MTPEPSPATSLTLPVFPTDMSDSIHVPSIPPPPVPSPVAISDWKWQEAFSTSSKPFSLGALLSFDVTQGLPDRRIYFLFDTKTSAAGAVILEAHIELFLKGRPAGRFPANIASLNGGTAARGFPTLFQAGGIVVQNSLWLVLPIATDLGVASIALQALQLNGEIDQIKFTIQSLSDAGNVVTGYYAFLGCLSTKPVIKST